MADGPKDYRDPKVTKADESRSKKGLWYILGLLAVLLLLAWLFGWIGGADEAAMATEEQPVIEEEDDSVVIPD